MKTLTLSGVLTALLSLCGCGDSPYGCSASVQRDLEVALYDAQTHAPIAKDAVGTIQDGDYKETLTPFRDDAAGNLISLAGALGRAGTYTIHIEKTGYQPWEERTCR